MSKRRVASSSSSFGRPIPALEIMEPTDVHLQMAAQVGTQEVVLPYSSSSIQVLQQQRDRVASFGMKFSVIERLLPHHKLVHGMEGKEQQLEEIKLLIQNMGKVGIKVLCYNWMPADDWTRTRVDEKERGGALVTSFDADMAEDSKVTLQGQTHVQHVTSREDLWSNLKAFLQAVLPVAEKAGVVLALHPDDPPMEEFKGKPQILFNADQLWKAANLVPSPSNGICFCQGTLASRGDDIVQSILKLQKFIKYIHFRDVVGEVPKFRETWTDNGKTDMAKAMQTYMACGLSVPIRPDHVPTMVGEDNSQPGYHMLGRLWAIGYIKGLQDSLASVQASNEAAVGQSDEVKRRKSKA